MNGGFKRTRTKASGMRKARSYLQQMGNIWTMTESARYVKSKGALTIHIGFPYLMFLHSLK
jgi:hypothetical protein